jgi:3alpha(or 20beta)-hydroxysteroid dehydrogenase
MPLPAPTTPHGSPAGREAPSVLRTVRTRSPVSADITEGASHGTSHRQSSAGQRGARGHAAAVASRLHGEGAKVILGGILGEQGKETAERIGSGALCAHLDVTSPQDWESAVSAAVETFGSLTILVNNAGIVNFASIEDYTLEQWNTVIAVNLTGTFNGIKAAIPALKQSKGGSIVNISSIAGDRGYEQIPGYTASKFGVRGLTRAPRWT